MYNVTKDFNNNYNVDFERGSGDGSLQMYGSNYCNLLISTLEKISSNRIVDYGCGNLETYRGYIDWKKTNHHYVGVDCSEIVIDKLLSKYPELEFHHINAFCDSEFLYGDVIIVKDVFIHWYDNQIEWFKKVILPKFSYGIFTHSDDLTNYDNGSNKWRPIHHENYFNVIDKKNVVLDRSKNFVLVSSV